MAKDKLFSLPVRYLVTEKKKTKTKTVICVLVDFFDEPSKDTWTTFLQETGRTVFGTTCMDEIAFKGAYKIANRVASSHTKRYGDAKCHESDTFDLETGKRIAYNKLRHRLESARREFLKECFIQIEKNMDAARARAKKYIERD